MSSATARRRGTAAWRISLWSATAFLAGTAIAFFFLQDFVAREIQRHGDDWLRGEVQVLAEVAEETPASRLHDVVVEEVAELASRETPHESESDHSVFFLIVNPEGRITLATGMAAKAVDVRAFQAAQPDVVFRSVRVPGFRPPFRVVGHRLSNGSTVYLGLSSDYEMAVIHRLRMEFLALWLALAGLGILIAYWTVRQTLERVEAITEAAAGIDRRSLDVRVPVGRHDDEIARLAKTFNQMLDRVQRAVRQLHTMTDSLAHDLRSPLTSIRGRLELALLAAEEPGPGLASARAASHDNLAAVVEEIDQLCTLLDNSLDLADANADALRLRLSEFDLDAMLRSLVELYEPALAQGGKTIRVDSRGPLLLTADRSLVERVLMNLLDNALKHLPAGTEIVCTLEGEGAAALLCFKDNGPGFRPETARERRNRPGPSPPGRGMGLAVIVAVVESHDGTVQFPAVERGSRIEIRLPLRPLRPGEPAGRAPAREPQQAT